MPSFLSSSDALSDIGNVQRFLVKDKFGAQTYALIHLSHRWADQGLSPSGLGIAMSSLASG